MALLAATIGPKLWLQQRSAQVDEKHLGLDLGRRLHATGFAIAVEHFAPGPAIFATRGACRLLIRNGDRARELGTLFRMEGAAMGPVLIGYRGHWSPRPARSRAVIERLAQDSAARIGIFFDRPAVLALAQGRHCPDVRPLLDPITVRASLKA